MCIRNVSVNQEVVQVCCFSCGRAVMGWYMVTATGVTHASHDNVDGSSRFQWCH